jgi:hypothetical protein
MALNRPIPPAGPGAPPPRPPVPPPKKPVEDEPIALVEESEQFTMEPQSPGESGVVTSIRPSGAAAGSAVRAIKSALEMDKRTQYKRKAVNTGQGAIRCRVFHCKIAESSIQHMESQINSWLDDEDVDVKHVGHVVGAMEGKHTEPNIIVLIWY